MSYKCCNGIDGLFSKSINSFDELKVGVKSLCPSCKSAFLDALIKYGEVDEYSYSEVELATLYALRKEGTPYTVIANKLGRSPSSIAKHWKSMLDSLEDEQGIDSGKVKALYRAGWSVAEISLECGIDMKDCVEIIDTI